ncbi:MAG: BrnA antitoxin family protein [Polaromonas sp.]|uniref:BrnA antitoxin family protein n=1 Tax=Polaromonas sp. TaxID=1869339 RepID=UPI0027371DCC|nr:BrnA antitoxin family protein [Polaromonas sp.]MDP2817669.1 BrnA antitoxin family protein [Polaromonas sp.]
MAKISSKRVILMPSVKDNAKIVAAARADPDAKPMTKRQLDALVPIRTVRGRPKSENKKLLLSVRYSVEVVEYFRSTGDGWQARMDSVLRQYVSQHEARSNVT